MALTAEQRAFLRQEMAEQISAARVPFTLTRAQFNAAIAAADDWIEANAASFNAAIPQPARGVLSPAQKAELLYRVARARFGG
jgi:hypothetical protein